MVISSNVLKDTKKTVTITQEVGTRDISSGLEKLKSLQKKITDNPELLSEFISENLDRIYNFEDLKSRREKYNNSVIANDKSYYGINTATIVDFFVKNINIAVKVSDLLKKGELPIVVDREKTRFNICLVEGSYHKNQYSATITDLHLTNSESYNDFLALIGEENMDIYKELIFSVIKEKTLHGYYLDNGCIPENTISSLDGFVKEELLGFTECATEFYEEPFMKIYFSFKDDWFLFEEPKFSEAVLLVDIKESSMLKRIFSEAVFNLDKDIFYNLVEKRILSGLKTKIKNLSKNKLTLRQVLKKEVSLTLLSDEQIKESLPEGLNIYFFEDLKKAVNDELQIARVFNAIESKMLDFQKEILEDDKKERRFTMAEILTKEIGTNQIAASFNKVKEYYLFSKENKESILKAVEYEFFDGYSFQDVKDYYKNMADEKVEEIKKNYGYDITIVRDYITNNPGVVEKIRSFFSYGTLTIDPSTVIMGSFKPTENPYQSDYRMVEILDFEYDIDTLIDSGIERFIPLEVLKGILGFFKAYYLSVGIQINKDDVNDVEKIIERITSSWSAKNALYNLNNIICGVSSERVYKQKVYFSLLKNKLVFSKTNCEDLLLIVEFKTTTAGFDLFKDCVEKDDMTEFYDYVVKRIISGLKRQTSRTISYTEYPLSSAVKGYVPICLYTDEEILSRISHFNINDIKSIIKNTSDPDQVKRLVKLWQDSMI